MAFGPPPGFTLDPPNYYPDPTRFRGGRMTSGRRTIEGNRVVGGVEGSDHIDGSASDYVPLPGGSLQQTLTEARGYFGPNARVGIHGNHVHASLPGYGQTPYFGERGTLGIDSPLPPGFMVDEERSDPEDLLRRLNPYREQQAAPVGLAPVSGMADLRASTALQSRPSLGRELVMGMGGDQGRPGEVGAALATAATGQPETQTRTITRRDDPARAGQDEQLRAMFADPSVSEGQILGFLESIGIPRSEAGGLDRAFAWRRSPEFQRWLALPADQRPAQHIDIESLLLAEPVVAEVLPQLPDNATPEQVEQWNIDRTQAASQGGQIREWDQNWGEAAGSAVAGASESLLGRQSAGELGRDLQSFMGYGEYPQNGTLLDVNPFSIVPPAEWATDYSQQAHIARMQGRPLDAAGNELLASGSGLLAIPILGAARGGTRAAQAALREVTERAAREGIDTAGPGASSAIADMVRRNWSDFSDETQQVLTQLRTARSAEGGAEALPIGPWLADDLQRVGTAPPSLLTRARERLTGRGAADEVAAAGRGDPGPLEIRTADDAAGAPAPQLPPPARQPDRIDVSRPPPGYALDPPGRLEPLPGGGARRMDDLPSAEAMAAGGRAIRPENLMPRAANRVESLDEARRANPGTIQDVRAPRPETLLEMRTYRHPIRGTPVRFRGPLDAEAFLRSRGGLRATADTRGELSHIGIVNNAGRAGMSGETRLGPILHPNGMSLDEAGEALTEAGYFRERPTTADVVEVLRSGRIGPAGRVWRTADLDEVEQFDNAAAMRDAVENAAQEGVPLAERVGQPIGPEDLDALDPPALAYEEVAALAGRVAGFNLSRMGNGREIAQSIRAIDDAFGIRAGAGGRRSWAESQALADEAGVSIEDILRSNSGQPLSDAEAIAYRTVLAKAHSEMMAIARRIQNGQGGDADRMLLEQAAQVVAAVQHKVTRRRAELARAMSVLRKTADPMTLRGPVLRRVIEQHGGPGRADDLARALVKAEDEGFGPGRINQLAARASKPGLRDMPIELFYSSILSAPTTHAINMLGNSGALALSVPEFALAAAIGSARNLFKRASDRIAMAEVAAYAGGLAQGVTRGLKLMPRVFRTGEDVDQIGKIDLRAQNAIPGRAGHIIRTPLRALAAEDAFFKAMARTGTQARLAWRNARQEGLKGDDLARRADELFQNPTEEMLEEAGDFARYMTFQETPGVFGSKVLAATNAVPELKFKIPFVRTLGNLVKFAAARSPVGLLMPSVWRELIAGGARRDLAISRMAIGSVIGWSAMEAADRGIVTGGGPLDFRERMRLEETGWQPYSLWVGDRYVSYRQLDPLSTIVGIAADLATYDQYMTQAERERSALVLGQMISRNMQDSFWLGSVTELMDLITDPMREGPGTVGSVAGALLVPNFISQPLASWDPVQRDQRATTRPGGETWSEMFGNASANWWETIRNRVMARVPGLRDNLPARENALGEPIRNHGRWGPDIISPFRQNLPNPDPVIQEMHTSGLRVGEPSRRTGDLRHTPQQQRELRRLSGRYIREGLDVARQTPGWSTMTPEDRQGWHDAIKRDARERARQELGLYEAAAPSSGPPPGFTVDQAPSSAMPPPGQASGPPAGFVLDR